MLRKGLEADVRLEARDAIAREQSKAGLLFLIREAEHLPMLPAIVSYSEGHGSFWIHIQGLVGLLYRKSNVSSL